MTVSHKAAVALTTFVLALLASLPARAQTPAPPSSRIAFSHALPALDGSRLTVDLVEVNYAPGASSLAHSHPCPVIVYVLEGAVRTQVRGQPESIYKAGESFYEPPNGVHLVSANAGSTGPARFIAFFVCDHVAPLSAPASGEQP